MEQSPPRRNRWFWLVLVTFGLLCLLPATRRLLRMQVQMETLTYARQPDLARERAVAERLTEDYPVQLAFATRDLFSFSDVAVGVAYSGAAAKARNRRIEALIERFPNNPSIYANFLRYMTTSEVHLSRDPRASVEHFAPPTTPYFPAPDALDRFLAAAHKGAELDPDNAYFPVMQAVGLFAAYRDPEALETLKSAGRCGHWSEYLQDEWDGLKRLEDAAYGARLPLRSVCIFYNQVFPQYASIRSMERVALSLAEKNEHAGNNRGGIVVRHALMRCGGLMRAQGDRAITNSVGIQVAANATSNPGGVRDPVSHSSYHRDTPPNPDRYYTYLATVGRREEVDWVKSELAAGDRAKAIVREFGNHTDGDLRQYAEFCWSWLANTVLLASTLILLVLGMAAHLAARICPRRAMEVGRGVFTLLLLCGIGCWQWKAACLAITPYAFLMGSHDGMESLAHCSDTMAFFYFSNLMIPALLVYIIVLMASSMSVPLPTGVGRGLRGLAWPTAAVMFLLYSVSLLPTVYFDAAITTNIGTYAHNESRYFAEHNHKIWPGDPQP